MNIFVKKILIYKLRLKISNLNKISFLVPFYGSKLLIFYFNDGFNKNYFYGCCTFVKFSNFNFRFKIKRINDEIYFKFFFFSPAFVNLFFIKKVTF